MLRFHKKPRRRRQRRPKRKRVKKPRKRKRRRLKKKRLNWLSNQTRIHVLSTKKMPRMTADLTQKFKLGLLKREGQTLHNPNWLKNLHAVNIRTTQWTAHLIQKFKLGALKAEYPTKKPKLQKPYWLRKFLIATHTAQGLMIATTKLINRTLQSHLTQESI